MRKGFSSCGHGAAPDRVRRHYAKDEVHLRSRNATLQDKSGKMIELTASDGTNSPPTAPSQGQSRGGLIVVQEIFGSTPHPERCRRYAADGYSRRAAFVDASSGAGHRLHQRTSRGAAPLFRRCNGQVMLDAGAGRDNVNIRGQGRHRRLCWAARCRGWRRRASKARGAVCY